MNLNSFVFYFIYHFYYFPQIIHLSDVSMISQIGIPDSKNASPVSASTQQHNRSPKL